MSHIHGARCMCMCWCNANIFDVHWTFAKEKINQASRSLCAYVCVCACECACDSCVTKNYGKQQKPGQVFSQNTKIKRIDSGAGWKTIFATTTNICNKRIREGERENCAWPMRESMMCQTKRRPNQKWRVVERDGMLASTVLVSL